MNSNDHALELSRSIAITCTCTHTILIREDPRVLALVLLICFNIGGVFTVWWKGTKPMQNEKKRMGVIYTSINM